MSHSDSIKVRRYQYSDFYAWQKLFNDTFGKHISPEFFSWKYHLRPSDTGAAFCWLAFDSSQNLIGARSAFPAFVRFGKNLFKVLQFGDSMVALDHRGKGVYRKLNDSALLDVENRGYDFIFNFPNQNSYPVLIKGGWHPIGRATKTLKILSPTRYLLNFILQKCRLPTTFIKPGYSSSGMLKKWKPAGFDYKEIDRFHKKHEELFENYFASYAHRYRNTNYLNWRYKEHPYSYFKCYEIHSGGNLAGIIVLYLRLSNNDSLIMELCGSSHISSLQLYQSAVYLAGLNQCNILRTWSIHQYELQHLKQTGFVKRPEPLYFVINTVSSELPESLLEVHNWWVTEGDNDSI